MYGFEVIDRPRPAVELVNTDLDQLEGRLQQRWPVLPTPVVLEWSDDLVVALDRQETAWLYGPAERDPSATSGGTVIPFGQRSRLRKIAALGVPFQRLAIAHELDRTRQLQDLLEELAAGPRRCSAELAQELVGQTPPHPLVAGTVRVLDDVLGSPGSAISSMVSSVMLDPILFGIIAPTPPRDGQLCLWYPLAAWRW
jgi:hypothetical protein